MRFPIWLTLIMALIGLGLVFVVGRQFIQPSQPLILSATFDDDTITPNADGESDITTFRYELSRNAIITLYFEAEDGTIFYFRQEEDRSPRDYAVLFSGVVDGYTLPDENLSDVLLIERRLIPDGVYTWHLVAQNDAEREEVSGTFTIQDSDSPLPLLTTFTLSSPEFTPNQDGVNDRLFINIFVEKEAMVEVFLIDEVGRELPIAQREVGSRENDDAGRYTFEYEGGVDLGQDPPPDGTYTVVASAQDAVGQRVSRQTDLTISLGGKPRAEVVPQFFDTDVFYTVQPYDERFFSDENGLGDLLAIPDFPTEGSVNLTTVPEGDMLVFRLTVRNYSSVPIRTTGPYPGAVYQQTQQASSLNALEEPGAWRIGIQCDTSLTSFPYRWAIGSPDDLITITDADTGREFRYLPPDATAEVWGAIRMTTINPVANPQTCWVGLIHEQVGISLENTFVSPREIEIVEMSRDGQ